MFDFVAIFFLASAAFASLRPPMNCDQNFRRTYYHVNLGGIRPLNIVSLKSTNLKKNKKALLFQCEKCIFCCPRKVYNDFYKAGYSLIKAEDYSDISFCVLFKCVVELTSNCDEGDTFKIKENDINGNGNVVDVLFIFAMAHMLDQFID